jgi:hypothetical protein
VISDRPNGHIAPRSITSITLSCGRSLGTSVGILHRFVHFRSNLKIATSTAVDNRARPPEV